jgi:hypothetical protein
MRRLGALARHWAEVPPSHLLLQWIARALGWRPAPKPKPQESWKDLMELAGDTRSGIAVSGKPPV